MDVPDEKSQNVPDGKALDISGAKIRELDLKEMREVFQKYMKKDFPISELRPFQAIEKVWERGDYSAYGFFRNEEMLAYSCFYAAREIPYVMMDYLAVIPELRGQGIGSAFLKKMIPTLTEWEGIFVEAESASSARTDSERAQRERRLRFYQKNGAVKTGVNCLLFGVDYNILYFPVKAREITEDKAAAADYFDTVCGLYQELYRRVYGGRCKPYIEKK